MASYLFDMVAAMSRSDGNEQRTQIWSSGGGVQSSAIAALICMGELIPDLSIIVDTERELSTTWDYLDRYVMPELQKVGVNLHRVSKSDYATVDIVRNDYVLIPAYTTEGADEIGKLPGYCSNEWKQRVVRRWANAQGATRSDVWLGITIDEKSRIKTPIGKWQNRYPLIDRMMTRADCLALVKIMGWPEPPRSSCYMCPNKSNHEWEWQKINATDDHQKAIEFEREIQRIDPDLWLTKSAIPLGDNDFSKESDLFSCDTGMCFV